MYSYFKHRRDARYRLVISSEAPFPPELEAYDWVFLEERPPAGVHIEVMNDIAQNGFGFFERGIRLQDIPAA
ncbi:hypothetical protein [Bosea sp. (in: a-proteobacteria)]|uniref:hypothetical protein n=1 Tax=Bosea sp. (in: a-proteobacteria) TaxID=1871050 RepID=UPI002621BAA9|nr:hypothetical protein [Bosea sp. (in: a-proteobacteria)]MCO5089775.1 hypothetical protein [Bosea sp. (in: a-proteobacteria)]